MLVLGLDISSVSTGWSLLNDSTLLDYGTIKIDPAEKHPRKLAQFAHDLGAIMHQHPDIDWVSIEDQYFQNVVTVKILSRFCGVAICEICRILDIGDVYSPDQLLAIADKKSGKLSDRGMVLVPPTQLMGMIGLKHIGNRDEKKKEIIGWANQTFGLKLTSEEDDAADSLALAYGTNKRIGEVLHAIGNRTQGKTGKGRAG